MEGVKTTMLITVDSYSDFIEVDILKGTTTAAIVECCKRNFARHGIPEVVVTDNGPQFTTQRLRNFPRLGNSCIAHRRRIIRAETVKRSQQ